MGCATLLALIVFFAIAFFGGGLWAIHYYKHKYTSPEPIEVTSEASAEEVTAPAPATPAVTPLAAAAAPASPSATPLTARNFESDWKAFEKAGKRNEKARIALSAAQINSLLQDNKDAQVNVSIDNNVARVRFSFALKNVPMLKGRYLNGEGTVTASADGDPAKAEISNIILAGENVPDSVIDQRVLGMKSLRSVISDWLERRNIRTFRIENNTVIGETGG